jgi:3-oxoacyl-[acyl-carrier-protein] synthase-3
MYAPPEIRGNDWWPREVVAGWNRGGPAPAIDTAGFTAGEARVVRAATIHRGDPFHGVVTRRAMAAEMSSIDAGELAARDALRRAAIDPSHIGLLLTHHVVAEHALKNAASALHERLGLAAECLSVETEATGYTTIAQLGLAEAMIASGRARFALLVQVSVGTRLVDRDDPGSPILGDGATAIVMGPVSPERGVLAIAHFTEGRYPLSLVMSPPGGKWYEGRSRIHVADPKQLAAGQLRTADSCEQAVRTALDRAGLGMSDVNYLCVGQGTAWLHHVVAEQLGLESLPWTDVFSSYGYLASAHVSAELFEAQQRGQIADNAVVVIAAGGTGMTYGAAVLRWGNR